MSIEENSMSFAYDTENEFDQESDFERVPFSFEDDNMSLSLIPESLPVGNNDNTNSQKCGCKKCIIFKKTSQLLNHSLEKSEKSENKNLTTTSAYDDHNPKRRRLHDYNNDQLFWAAPVIVAGYVVLPQHIFESNQGWNFGP